MLPLAHLWRERVRWHRSADGPRLALHSQEYLTIDYLVWWFDPCILALALALFWWVSPWFFLLLAYFPIRLFFNMVHERTHALLSRPSDCQNVCVMYGGKDKDSWSEKNPMIWFKVLKLRWDTGFWHCQTCRAAIEKKLSEENQ
jgi:hypothetical protein